MSSRTHAPETNIASDSDEDPPQLSEHALTALQEFYAEQLAREQLLEATLQAGGGAGGGAGAGPVPIEEDWVSHYKKDKWEGGERNLSIQVECGCVRT